MPPPPTPFLSASQVATRAITFALNLATARLLTVDAYGVRQRGERGGEGWIFSFFLFFG